MILPERDDAVDETTVVLDATDRRLIRATQAGLPLTPRPFHDIAQQLGIPDLEVMRRIQRMLDIGVIRRIGAVPNHYRLGYVANGMSVWDVADERIAELGREVGALPFVSHCYERPRHPPMWPYNLFAMVHARSRTEIEQQVARIGELLGAASRGHDVLYSTAILKKTGLRVSD